MQLENALIRRLADDVLCISPGVRITIVSSVSFRVYSGKIPTCVVIMPRYHFLFRVVSRQNFTQTPATTEAIELKSYSDALELVSQLVLLDSV